MKSRRRKNKIGGQFSPRLIEMLESPAWRILSLSARRVIERVEIELGHHGGNDNGNLPVTYEDFLEFGIGDRSGVAAARREAVALGFLRFTPGRAGNREFRRPDLFGITFAVGDATHEWRKIQTLEQAFAVAQIARQAKDPRAVEIGRVRALRRKSKQNASLESSGFSIWKNQTETTTQPVWENRTTAGVGKTGPQSISGDGARSAPASGAEASAPSSETSSSRFGSVVDLIVQSLGCTREEALSRLESMPDRGG